MENNIKVPFVNLGLQFEEYKEEILDKFRELSSSGQYVMGEELTNFEQNIAKYCGVNHALGVGNGTDAIVIALKCMGIGPGDEVITTPNTFIGTVGAIKMVGAQARLVDVGDDYNMSPDKLEEVITDKTKALIPVHLTGMPANMDAINSIARKYNLFVVEDSAQAIGATYNNKKVGSLADVGCFSLHPLKNLHVHGDGGLITTNNSELYEKMKVYRNHGLIDRDTCSFWGINSRLDEIQAAIANIKLKSLDRITERFREIALRYDEGLKDLDIARPVRYLERLGVYHNYVLRVPRRSDLMNFLETRGVQTKIHYPKLIHVQPAARELGYKLGDFQESERQAQEILSLPIYPELKNEQVDYVIQCVRDFFTK